MGTPNPAFANINNTQIVTQTNGTTVNFNIALYNNPNIPFQIGQTYGYEVRCQCADGSGFSDWSGISPESTFIVPSLNIGSQENAELVGIKSLSDIGITLFPNPNDGRLLFLTFDQESEDRFIIRVTDARGMLVFEESYNGVQKGNQLELDFNERLSAGMYMIQAIKHDMSLQERFIVR